MIEAWDQIILLANQRAPIFDTEFNRNCFHGKLSKNFDQWLQLFEVYSQANGFDDGRKCKILPSKLCNHALLKYNLIPVNEKDILDYEQLVDQLWQKYSLEQAWELKTTNLNSQKQKNSEMVTEFMVIIQQLAIEGYPEVPPKAGSRWWGSFYW